jgi:hypothetical protein
MEGMKAQGFQILLPLGVRGMLGVDELIILVPPILERASLR